MPHHAPRGVNAKLARLSEHWRRGMESLRSPDTLRNEDDEDQGLRDHKGRLGAVECERMKEWQFWNACTTPTNTLR